MDLASIPAGGSETDFLRFEKGDACAGFREMECCRKTRISSTDHADIDPYRR